MVDNENMNKIILAQINTLAGDIKENAQKIKKYISRAKNDGANLIIFPELSLLGYPFGDIIIRHKSIIKRQIEELNEIAAETNDIPIINLSTT